MKNHKKASLSFTKITIKLFSMIVNAAPIQFLAVNVASVLRSLFFVLITISLQRFFDSIVHVADKGLTTSTIIQPTIVLGTVILLSEVINAAHSISFLPIAKKGKEYFNMKIHEKAFRLSPIDYEQTEKLDDINKAQEGSYHSMGIIFQVSLIFTYHLPYTIFMGWYLYSLKPLLSLSIVIIFIPLLITQLVRSVMFTKLEDEAAPIRRQYEYYERCICGRRYFKETYILGATKFFKQLYMSSLKLLVSKTWSKELKTTLIELGMRMLTLLGYFGVLYLLISSLIIGDITVGAFAAVFAAIVRMFALIEEVVCTHMGQLTRNLGTVRNFISFLSLGERTGNTDLINASNKIVLKNVTFRYPNAAQDSLSHISLNIKPKETLAIVGENGAGKTTLVKLITGLYLPTTGQVLIDGHDTNSLKAKSIYRHISAVFQKYQKYHMTLRDNITISDIEKDDTESQNINSAIKKADLDVDSQSFKNGYDTMLSREFDGVDLSEGQWQRVSIARGFFRAHNMIILDEPTASIDPIEETRIYNKFIDMSYGKTAIIVTHRLGSAKIADRIIVMSKGSIADIGTHNELISRDGIYKKMYNAQAKWYK